MDFTKEQKAAIINYLVISTGHTELEKKLSESELLPMTNVFQAISELNKHFTSEEVDYFIIHRDELAKKFLN